MEVVRALVFPELNVKVLGGLFGKIQKSITLEEKPIVHLVEKVISIIFGLVHLSSKSIFSGRKK